MKNHNIRLAFWGVLASYLLGMASAGRADEIPVTIPMPAAIEELPSGAKIAQLSRKDIEFAAIEYQCE